MAYADYMNPGQDPSTWAARGASATKELNRQLNETVARYDALAIRQNQSTREMVAFTDATGRGRITMENFGRTFDNATRKVIVWQFAILAVYGVMRRFEEVIQIWRDFEVTLARISITTGAVGDRLMNFFKQTADVAIEFGVSIDQALTGMDLALRATAGIEGNAKRSATAVQLLRDASVLANITGMQYSQSIDILVGSLRQSGMELDQGLRLLDKWTAVAKNAAVSVSDLSQGFAIMADAGRAAGLTVDQINGLIAALSETVTLGPVEIGNSIRALMSTLYNPGSIQIMQKFGVAVRDTTGEVRSFWDVMEQLSAMRISGILDDSIWLEIAKAAGAGQRRYAQFLALLNNFSTAMRVAGISSNAEGQALDANRKIVDTLTNSFDKFTAAQRKFAFTLGDQTGAISDLSGALLKLTRFFDVLSGSEFKILGLNLRLTDTFYTLGRGVMFLVGTLAALKVASVAMGWFGVAPRVGALLGGMAGLPSATIAGTGAARTAFAAGGYTSMAAGQAAGIGVIAPTQAMRAGLLGLTGLLPSFLRDRLQQSLTGGASYNQATGRWMGYQPTGRYGFVPAPQIAGQPVSALSWGGIGQRLTQPVRGLGTAIGALGAGALAYGVTKEVEAGLGAAVGTAVGGWFGGPAGMAVGGAFGTLIGHTIADAMISDEQRIKDMFTKISEDFGINVGDKVAKELEKISPEQAGRLAAAAFPGERLAEAAPFWARLSRGGLALGGPLSQPNALSFTAPWVQRPGEREWTEGLGALPALNQALLDGVITVEEYRDALGETRVKWEELSDAAKAYMTVVEIQRHGLASPEMIAQAEAYAQAVREMEERARALAEINSRYADSQDRIKTLMTDVGAAIEGVSLKEWEQTEIQRLLQKQMRMTSDEFQAWYDVLLGASYGYASHLESIERLTPLLSQYGLTLNAIPEDKWLAIQKWDTTLATRIVETAQTLTTLTDEIDRFGVNFADMLELAGVEGTIDDIDRVRDALQELFTTTGEEKYGEALSEIDQYMADILQKDIEARRFGTLTQAGAQYQRPTEVRLVDTEELEAYTQQLGRLPALTQLAESLGKFDTSVLTLVDPITGQTLRMEENTLAMQMLGQFVKDNTDAVKMLEATYNLPGWYQEPNRFWAMRSLGGDYGGFGPQQKDWWDKWASFLAQGEAESSAVTDFITRATATQTEPITYQESPVTSLPSGVTTYGAVGKESPLETTPTISDTNVILGNSYRVLVDSQQYLSSINLGIQGLRDEIRALRAVFSGSEPIPTTSELVAAARAGVVGIGYSIGGR